MNVFNNEMSIDESFDPDKRFYKISFRTPSFEDFSNFYPDVDRGSETKIAIEMDNLTDAYFDSGNFIYDVDLYNISDVDYVGEDGSEYFLSDLVVDQFVSEISDPKYAKLTGSWKYTRDGTLATLEWETPEWFDETNFLGGRDLDSLRSRMRDLYVFL